MTNHLIMVIIIIAVLIVYYFIERNNKKIMEKFTTLIGIEDPRTTFDDYGTFNGIYHFDDLPYYDPTYENMLQKYEDECNSIKYWKDPGSIHLIRENNDDYSKDSFVCDAAKWKIRRSLIPANYSNHPEYADAEFDQRTNNYILINTTREKRSSVPPWPNNVYFEK